MPVLMIISVRQILPFLCHKQGNWDLWSHLISCAILGKSLLSKPWCSPHDIPVITAPPPGFALGLGGNLCGKARILRGLVQVQNSGDSGSALMVGICSGQPCSPKHLSSKWEPGAPGVQAVLGQRDSESCSQLFSQSLRNNRGPPQAYTSSPVSTSLLLLVASIPSVPTLSCPGPSLPHPQPVKSSLYASPKASRLNPPPAHPTIPSLALGC